MEPKRFSWKHLLSEEDDALLQSLVGQDLIRIQFFNDSLQQVGIGPGCNVGYSGNCEGVFVFWDDQRETETRVHISSLHLGDILIGYDTCAIQITAVKRIPIKSVYSGGKPVVDKEKEGNALLLYFRRRIQSVDVYGYQNQFTEEDGEETYEVVGDLDNLIVFHTDEGHLISVRGNGRNEGLFINFILSNHLERFEEIRRIATDSKDHSLFELRRTFP